MLESLMNLISLCWSPLASTAGGGGGGAAGSGGGGTEGREGLLRYRDFGRCGPGVEFSTAVVQANQVLEDQSQIEAGEFGTFVGIYDGHGGPHAARYVCDHLFRNFDEISSGQQGVTSDGIRRAFLETEEGFIDLVSQLWDSRLDMATNGTCCLVGVISQRTLYVANLGDSRVVLGKKVGSTGEIAAVQLSTEHNANLEAVRQELKAQHPNDPQVVVLKHGVWRVKGIIQGSAKTLIKAALQEAARKREMRYSDLKKIDKKVRRHFHDDITVTVLFLNYDQMCQGHRHGSPLSIRSALEH